MYTYALSNMIQLCIINLEMGDKMVRFMGHGSMEWLINK